MTTSLPSERNPLEPLGEGSGITREMNGEERLRGAPLFDEIDWRDPLTGKPLEALVASRTPSGVPLHGALRVSGTSEAYPIVDSVVRLTPELALRFGDWLAPFGLKPAGSLGSTRDSFQAVSTVESFGFQWTFNSEMRSEADLRWRVADRFGLGDSDFKGRLALDAGAGAGDQSRWMIQRGASVVSVDLSDAIDLVSAKLRMNARWVGVQGDVTNLPVRAGGFDIVYCEGVLMVTRDTEKAIGEFARVLRPGGFLLATHYLVPRSLRGRLRLRLVEAVRGRLKKRERYETLWITGTLAALAYVPLLGWAVRRSGLAMFSDRMPSFQTTWTNTHDSYGGHAFQRYLSAEEFRGLFEGNSGIWASHRFATDAIAVRRSTAPLPPQ
jgi:ubiquinone/menaquinone biosynthesis C-methylase UbiE